MFISQILQWVKTPIYDNSCVFKLALTSVNVCALTCVHMKRKHVSMVCVRWCGRAPTEWDVLSGSAPTWTCSAAPGGKQRCWSATT